MQLTPEIREKRVAIARDVQSQIRANAYSFRAGNGYIAVRQGSLRWLHDLGGDLQQHVEAAAQECDVCLLGGLLLSKARLYNHAPVHRLGYWLDGELRIGAKVRGAEVKILLEDVFDREIQNRLEAAFESDPHYNYHADIAQYDHHLATASRGISITAASMRVHCIAGLFGQTAGRRGGVKAIVWACMNNLIANNGEFEPDQKPDLTGYPGPRRN